jgi:amino acid adenylation domain-containing protein
VAHYLQSLGVGPEVLVGICVERSLDMIVGLLGIFKAGGAYVPLDPHYPRERLAFMLVDAHVPVLLTHQSLAGVLPRDVAKVVYLDAEWDEIARASRDNPASGVGPQNLAYVIYTSGSTGQPKGVQLAHQGVINLAFWHNQVFAVTPRDRATLFSSLSFDASVGEIWPYLLIGASVHIIDEETRLSPSGLRDWLADRRITISFLPTPVAENILSLGWPQSAPLRTVLTGGDQLHQYPSSLLPFELVNNYGPTESTMVATAERVPFKVDIGKLPAIGRPISNTRLYVLDRSLQPVPVGVAGELYLGGEGLARGYLNRPALTAERFVPDPFGNGAGSRLYRTGDLVRYLTDGRLEFLGRADQQVKVRGYRIELGEIESVLRGHPRVQEAVVIAGEDGGGLKRLIGYVVSRDGEVVGVSELREHLRERLPEYMVPSGWVMLEKMPLTPNGKVDRRALAAVESRGVEEGRSYVAPRTATEELLAGIWLQVLGVERVGVTDNFFELGGHSLLATRVISQVKEIFHVDVSLRYLFEMPTVEGLAAALAGSLEEGDDVEAIATTFLELENLSEDEVKAILLEQNAN